MAFNSTFSLLLFPFLFLLLLSTQTELPILKELPLRQTTYHEGLEIGKISSALSDRGYHAMSLTLEMTLEALIPSGLLINNTPVTVFCPSDKPFASLKYPQPPLTLLQYHVAPLKLDRITFFSSFSLGSKIETLLLGHPLVATSLNNIIGIATINEVMVTDWEIYNDGRVIVHGVNDFFDPAFQTLRYPEFDGEIIKNDGESSSDLDMEDFSEYASSFCWVGINRYIVFLVFAITAAIFGCLVALICCWGNRLRYHGDCGFVYVDIGVHV